MLWTRRDMVDRSTHTKDIPLTKDGKVQIEISLRAYKHLVNWASVGRTIDGVKMAIEDETFDKEMVLEDLNTLKQPLSDCHDACRNHWFNLTKETK